MSVRNIIDFDGNKLIYPVYVPPYSLVLGYGQFSSDQTQQINIVNTPQAITHNQTEISQFCDISGSKIYVRKAGVWRIAYSVQLYYNSGANNSSCEIFIKVNGNTIARSATRFILSKNLESLAYTDYILNLNLNDYIEVFFVSNNNSMRAYRLPEVVGQYPEVPSSIITMFQLT
jgi:hypothetical protein